MHNSIPFSFVPFNLRLPPNITIAAHAYYAHPLLHVMLWCALFKGTIIGLRKCHEETENNERFDNALITNWLRHRRHKLLYLFTNCWLFVNIVRSGKTAPMSANVFSSWYVTRLRLFTMVEIRIGYLIEILWSFRCLFAKGVTFVVWNIFKETNETCPSCNRNWW